MAPNGGVAVIEKLTDEERERLVRASAHTGLAINALRIIDAQAAVIERVRALCQVDLSSAGRIPKNAFCRQVIEALAAAPEHTAASRNTYEVWVGSEKTKERIVLETSDIEQAARVACADLSGRTFWGMKAPEHTAPDDWHPDSLSPAQEAYVECRSALADAEASHSEATTQLAVSKDNYQTALSGWNQEIARASLAESKLAAANAVVAELRTELTGLNAELARMQKARNDANARADAAEMKAHDYMSAFDAAVTEREEARSEALALRAQLANAEAMASEWKQSAEDHRMEMQIQRTKLDKLERGEA